MANESQPDPTILAYVEAALPVLGLTIDPAWRTGIVSHFEGLAAIGQLVTSFPLEDEWDAAPVYTA